MRIPKSEIGKPKSETACSADFQSAVAPTSSRQFGDNTGGFGTSERLRIADPRYSRLETCATGWPGAVSPSRRLAVSFLIALLAAAVPGVRASDASLVAWYPFEGDVRDSSDYRNDGVNNGVVFQAGWNGLCGTFNGGSAFVRIPQAPSIKLTGPMTISAWIKPLATDGLRCIVDKDYGFVGYNLYIDGGRLHMRVCSWAFSAGTIRQGNWQHVAGVYTGDRIRLYVNGQPCGETPAGALVDRSDKDVYLGMWGPPGGPSRYFSGWMDDVRIDARALTAEEILWMTRFTLDWWTVDGGGSDPFSVGQFTLAGTVGQPDASEPQTVGPYSLSGGFWSMDALHTPGAPWLSIFRTRTDAVAVTWPAYWTGWGLQQNTNGVSSPNWSNVTGGISDDGTTLSLTVNPPTGNQFFRLRKP
jgi:hypothetical protein